jgi:DNA-binding transcriptional ArsR family regulator
MFVEHRIWVPSGMKQHPHPPKDAITITGVLAALSDPVRLEIVASLRQGERASSGFDCSVSNSTLSHHVRTLREAGVIVHRKEGTRCFVSIRQDLDELFPGLIEAVLRFAPERTRA